MLCPYAKVECVHCKDDEEVLYKNIIDNLNLQTGKHYRIVEATKKLILARWKEGFRYPDFVKVHENMTKAWTNTEQEIYLRPVTLYCASKFEGYLNYKNGNGSSIKIKETKLYDKMVEAAKGNKHLSKIEMGDELFDYSYSWLTQRKTTWPKFCHDIINNIPIEEVVEQVDFKTLSAGG